MTGMRGCCLAFAALIAPLAAQADQASPLSVEKLVSDGWEIAGFAAALTAFGSVILFKHKDRKYFVQCSAVYDATRGAQVGERVVTNCYEIH